MPTDTPVEISAVAIRNKAQKHVLKPTGGMPVPISAAVFAGSRMYMSGVLGRDATTNRMPKEMPKQAMMVFDRAATLVKQGKRKLSDLDWVFIYHTSAMPRNVIEQAANIHLGRKTRRAFIETSALPFGSNVEITGASGSSGTYLVGPHTGDTNQVLSALKKDIEALGLTMNDVVAANVYINDIERFAEMNKVYATFFSAVPPTRTTVQPTPVGEGKPNTISLFVAR
jgi:enamine deaminase RidA (YjgF/YER057c/UK114 family)